MTTAKCRASNVANMAKLLLTAIFVVPQPNNHTVPLGCTELVIFGVKMIKSEPQRRMRPPEVVAASNPVISVFYASACQE